MRSEIPQLEVITAIADADFEDFVAQLLFSQGWSIIYRAFDAMTMEDFLRSRSGLRTVIIYKTDLPGMTSQILMDYPDEPYTFISLDGSEPAAHAIMQKIRSQLRLPLVQTGQHIGVVAEEPRRHIPQPKVITITGSAGAPGRTTLALALAGTMGSDEGSKVALIDADFRSPALSRRLTSAVMVAKGKKPPALQLLPLDPATKPTALPQVSADQTMIVDLGMLPSLGEAVHDRRWQGSLVHAILEATTHLLYVVRSTQDNLDELAHFLKEFPILLRKIPITYICILVGTSRELRESEARFLTLTTAENRFLFRESQLRQGAGSMGLLGVPGILGSPKPGKGEIGKIAQSLM